MTIDKLDKNVVFQQLGSSDKSDVVKLSDLKKKIEDLKLEINEMDEMNQNKVKVKGDQDANKSEVNNATLSEMKEDLQSEESKILHSEAIKETNTTDAKPDSHDHEHDSCGCCTQFDDDYDCDSDIDD